MLERKTDFVPYAQGLSLEDGIYHVIVSGMMNSATIAVRNNVHTVLFPTRNGVTISLDQKDYRHTRLAYTL